MSALGLRAGELPWVWSFDRDKYRFVPLFMRRFVMT